MPNLTNHKLEKAMIALRRFMRLTDDELGHGNRPDWRRLNVRSLARKYIREIEATK